MGKRPRIGKEMLVPIEADPLEFKENKSSKNARQLHTHVENIQIDVWFDKHYYTREQHGDENGKRHDIELAHVTRLLQLAMKHLIYYSLRLPNFTFLNFAGQAQRSNRILLQERFSTGETLNVAVEYHYVDFNKYELTVKTAMRVDDFRVSDGQYVLEVYNETSSELKRFEGKKFKVIFNN